MTDDGDRRGGNDPLADPSTGWQPPPEERDGTWARQWWGVLVIAVTVIFVVTVIVGLVMS